MGGFFGITSKNPCHYDLFFGVDYHSHLGTRRGGMVMYDREAGFQRAIHNIESSPFRTKFEHEADDMVGNAGIACISDYEPQPLLIRSHLGNYAITTVGKINNEEELVTRVLNQNRHFLEMSGGRINATELVAALVNEGWTIPEGIRHAQEKIEGSMSIMILTPDCIYAARDRYGRLPVMLGRRDDGYAVSFESFAYQKVGYVDMRDLGPGEIVRITPEGVEVVQEPQKKMRICAFLWTYYGYPNSHYEGVTVETMRTRCGEIMAQNDMNEGLDLDIDYVAGIPDSGTAHAIGYANRSRVPFARPFIKYTPTWPRSFMPTRQSMRNLVARMKLVPVRELIEGKSLLMVDDSIVRGTQTRETVQFLYESGAKAVHIRSGCPPITYGCKYLNFSRSSSEMELIARRVVMKLEGEDGFRHMDEYSDIMTDRGKAMIEEIGRELNFTSLRFQTLKGELDAIGIDPENICTYCWTGKE
ncbi:MAG: amidophosphoribosyltransferase [Ruminococcaceae bacterium]|jgi:amidophosphoribosyltransferase|nr:amidophosphoribosyltransferase [Oscillospiraceae bacterium]